MKELLLRLQLTASLVLRFVGYVAFSPFVWAVEKVIGSKKPISRKEQTLHGCVEGLIGVVIGLVFWMAVIVGIVWWVWK